MARRIKVIFEKLNRTRMHRHVSNLGAFAVNEKMFDATPFRVVLHPKTAQLCPTQRVIKKHRQDCPVAFSFPSVSGRGFDKGFCLRVRQGRSFAFGGSFVRTLDALYRIVGNGVGLAEALLIGRDAGMPELIVFFSMVGGIGLFGVMGFLVGPMIAALVQVLLEIYRKEFSQQLASAHHTTKADS
jgi:hypothetical protein